MVLPPRELEALDVRFDRLLHLLELDALVLPEARVLRHQHARLRFPEMRLYGTHRCSFFGAALARASPLATP